MAFRSKKKDKKAFQSDLKKKSNNPKISAPTSIPPHLLKTKSRFDSYNVGTVNHTTINNTFVSSGPGAVTTAAKPRLNLQVEPEPFMVDNFDDDRYLESLGALEDKGIKSFHQNLQDAHIKSTQKIQKHVYRHYHEFVTISKEITKLETDINELNDILSDLQTVGEVYLGKSESYDGQDNDEPNAQTLPRDQMSPPTSKSNSLVEQIVSNDEENKLKLAKIWKAVQGSEEYLPYVPYRCPVMESPGWKELDPNTFRPKRDANFFLLTDSFLVAVRAKRQTMLDITQATKASLIARSCWSLKEIHVSDVKDSANGVENAFKVTRKMETFIFMAMNKDEKRRFLKALARANNEYINRQKKQALQKGSIDSIASPTSSLAAEAHGTTQDETNPLDNDFWNTLDVHINHHHYKEATEQIINAKGIVAGVSNTSLKNELQNQLDLRIKELSSSLINNITNCPHSSKKILLNNVKLLIRLNLIEEAQKVFFESRKNIIRVRIRQLKLDGNTLNFIRELSRTVFLLILNTCKWYTPNFTDLSMGSALINWVRSELEYFCQLFRNQVFDNNIEFSVIENCLKVANAECRKLREVGMDLNFVLDQLFLPDITKLASDPRYQIRR